MARKTPSSKKAPIRCLKRNWIASCCMCVSAIPIRKPSTLSCDDWCASRLYKTAPPLKEPCAFPNSACSRRGEVMTLNLAPALESYIVALVMATQSGPVWLELSVGFGTAPAREPPSPWIAVLRAHAWLHGRDYVSPEDIQAIAPDVLRHRVLLTFEAEADGIDTERFIAELLDRVPVP